MNSPLYGLTQIARAATPGRWFWHEDGNMYVDPASEPTEYNELGTAIIQTDGWHYGPAHADRAHIATFTPERVLRLLAVVRLAEQAAEVMERASEDYDITDCCKVAPELRAALAELEQLNGR